MRIKRGVTSHKRHNKIRRATKGMSRPHRSSIKRGKQAVTRSLVNATRDRKVKKRTLRQLWNARINAAARQNNTTYSKLIANLNKNKVELNRKVLAEIAVSDPKSFTQIVKNVSK